MKKTPVLILIGMALVLMLACASAGFADGEAINQVNSEPLDMEILSPEGNYVSSAGKIPISLQSAAGSIVTVKVYPLESQYYAFGSFRLNVRDMVVEYHSARLPKVTETEEQIGIESDETLLEPADASQEEVNLLSLNSVQAESVTQGSVETVEEEAVVETLELPSLPQKMFSETIGQTGRWLYELSLQPGRYVLLIQTEGNMRRSEEYALSVTVTSLERATEFLEMLEEESEVLYTPAVLAPIQRPLSMY